MALCSPDSGPGWHIWCSQCGMSSMGSALCSHIPTVIFGVHERVLVWPQIICSGSVFKEPYRPLGYFLIHPRGRNSRNDWMARKHDLG